VNFLPMFVILETKLLLDMRERILGALSSCCGVHVNACSTYGVGVCMCMWCLCACVCVCVRICVYIGVGD